MLWLVEITVVQPTGALEGRREVVTTAYAELRKLEGILDPDMSAALADGVVKFSFILDAEDRTTAWDQGSVCGTDSAAHRRWKHPRTVGTRGDAVARSRFASQPVAVSVPVLSPRTRRRCWPPTALGFASAGLDWSTARVSVRGCRESRARS